MPLIKFYRADYSSAGITDAVLRELEAATGRPLAERIDVTLRSGTREPDFLAVNPNGFVPALVLPKEGDEEEEETLWESAAITMYLGETYGVDAGLYPAATTSSSSSSSAGGSSRRRAQAAKWIVWSNVNLPMHARQISRVVHGPKDDDAAVQALREKDAEAARAELGKLLRVLDGGLRGKEYLLATGYSLADTHIWAFMSYIKMLGVDLDSMPDLKAWIDRVGAREPLQGL
ncbi:hypothetical protein V2A60_009288 [Cordyceps javanica]